MMKRELKRRGIPLRGEEEGGTLSSDVDELQLEEESS